VQIHQSDNVIIYLPLHLLFFYFIIALYLNQGGIPVKTYTSREKIPLKFHYFNIYFRLPISLLYLLSNMANAYLALKQYDEYGYLYSSYDKTFESLESFIIGANLFFLPILIANFVGFIKFKKYGYNFFYFHRSCLILYFILLGILLKSSGYYAVATGYAVGFALEGVYYYKRRLLFTDDDEESPNPKINDFSATDLSSYNRFENENVIVASDTTNTTLKKTNRIHAKLINHNISIKQQKRYCKFCGGLIDSKTKKCTSCGKQYFKFRKKMLIPLVALVIVVCSLLLGFYIKNIKTENDFYGRHVAIIYDNDNRYHKYGCPSVKDTSKFWIMGITAAEREGHNPCPYCH